MTAEENTNPINHVFYFQINTYTEGVGGVQSRHLLLAVVEVEVVLALSQGPKCDVELGQRIDSKSTTA